MNEYSNMSSKSNLDSNLDNPKKTLIAICQMCSSSNKEDNYKVCETFIQNARQKGACFVFLPECFDYMMTTSEESVNAAEELDGALITKYRTLAKTCGIWLSLGGFHHRPKQVSEADCKIENLHVIIDDTGTVKSTYAKTHMFDVDIPGKVRLKESDHTIPGAQVVSPINTPIGKVGLQICYDLRFPELSTLLRHQGADILTFPSAFTQPTGQAHWESLLRSRAIENQCYVVAAAQVGRHNEKRTSYGHAMVIDPWGKVVVDCGEDICVNLAEIDLSYIRQVRDSMPVIRHKRCDLYICPTSPQPEQSEVTTGIDQLPVYPYGHVSIKSSQVFYRSALSYACVNIKPVLPGHVLVVALRPAERIGDLTPPEVNDLFMSVQTVSDVVRRHFQATSLTVAVQDGPDSGQTIKQVHVHVIPRRPNDMPFNDDIYNKLQTHDVDMTDARCLRSEAEMEQEATALRGYFATRS